MIIIINGSFGIGKTSVAQRLVKLIPNSSLFDPELVGSLAQDISNEMNPNTELPEDFQEISLWPRLVVNVVRTIREKQSSPLVVPITIDNYDRLVAIRGGFLSIDSCVRHYCLTAPLDVIQRRLHERGVSNGEWVQRRATECVARLAGKRFETFIDTTDAGVEEVAAVIQNDLARERPRLLRSEVREAENKAAIVEVRRPN